MAFLPRQEIKRLADDEKLFVCRDSKDGKNYDEANFKQASYDLRLGDEIYVVGRRAPEKLTDRSPYALLPPGQFAILTTYEEVCMPRSVLGFIAIRTKFKLQGLVNISGFHVDPSFHGKLVFAVQNVGPNDIRVKLGEPTFTIFFAELKAGDIGETRDNTEVHFKQNMKGIRLEDVQLLGGGSITLAGLQKEVQRLRTLVLVYGPFAVAAFIALLIKLFRNP